MLFVFFYASIDYLFGVFVMAWSSDNLKDKQLWMRVGYTLLVLVVMGLFWDWLYFLLMLIWVGQSVCWMFSGKPNGQGVAYSRFFVMLFYQYLEYLTYTNSEKPYPMNYLP